MPVKVWHAEKSPPFEQPAPKHQIDSFANAKQCVCTAGAQVAVAVGAAAVRAPNHGQAIGECVEHFVECGPAAAAAAAASRGTYMMNICVHIYL